MVPMRPPREPLSSRRRFGALVALCAIHLAAALPLRAQSNANEQAFATRRGH